MNIIRILLTLLIPIVLVLTQACTNKKAEETEAQEENSTAPVQTSMFDPELVQGFLQLSGETSLTARAGSEQLQYTPEILSVISEFEVVTFTCVYDRDLDGAVTATTSCDQLTGLTFDTNTGALAWSPTLAQKGYYEFKITMTQTENTTDLLFTFSARTNFVTVWQTDNTGPSNDDQITLPLTDDGTYDFTVDWGDGQTDRITTYDDPKTTHTYTSAGTYTVTIDGQIDGWRFNNGGDRQKILEISNWGNFRFGNRDAYFHGAINMTITASDILDTSLTTNWSAAFSTCTSLVNIPNIGSWDMSRATSFRTMFDQSSLFNADIGAWDVSNVVDMEFMLRGTSFNQDVSSWDVSNAENLSNLFANSDFAGDVSNWNVSKVVSFSSMFQNTPFSGVLSNWDVSSGQFFITMFAGANNFNSDISGWDVSSGDRFEGMFSGATLFNQDISSWDTSSGEKFQNMFTNAIAFDQNLGSWDISSASDMAAMFNNSGLSTANYDAILNGWNANPSTPDSITFGATGTNYTTATSGAARSNLTGTKLWTITDAGGI